MKQNKQISSFLKRVPLMVALLAAFVFSASNGLRPILQETDQQIQARHGQASQEEDERPLAYLDMACSALAPVAQFIYSHQPFIKAPFPSFEYVVEKLSPLPPLQVDRYFRTLFCLIISPNAP